MTNVEEHIKAVRALLKDVESKVRTGTIVEAQKIVGFSCSEASCDLFGILLHKKNLITPGFNINHRFFASEKIAKKKFSFDFQEKERLISMLVKQEGFRERLCYGKEKEKEVVEKCIANAFKIKEAVEGLIGETI